MAFDKKKYWEMRKKGLKAEDEEAKPKLIEGYKFNPYPNRKTRRKLYKGMRTTGNVQTYYKKH